MLQETIHFERFELDPGAFELRRDGQLIKLERIPLQLLLLLAENRQRLVTREEILHVIWGENVFVDADNSINTAVRKARQALKDDPENPRFLRTVPGKGYRFTAEVKTVNSTVSPGGLAAVEQLSQESATPTNAPADVASPSRNTWAILALIGVLVVVGAVLMFRPRPNAPPQPSTRKAMLAVLPFVNLSGNPGEDYLADGMTEEIITHIGGVDPKHVGVIA